MEKGDVKELVELLEVIREEEYLTMAGMAHRMGFSAGHLSMVLSGKRRPGIRFVRAAMRTFPRVRRLVAKQIANLAATEDD